jgi:serine/threonine-protein kinase
METTPRSAAGAVTRLARFAKELHRRKVTRAALAYGAAAFVIIQAATATFSTLPVPAWSGTLVTVLLALGFPVALVLAWALEITPQGLREELSAEEADRVAAIKALRPDAIAVLPFENLSADPENDYFSDGITEDVIASIARIRGIRVLARPSVARYKGRNVPVGQVARELGVATLVTGSVRRTDGRLRVVVHVLDARDDTHRWSETYDRRLGDVFEIQGEIAAHVATAVRRELTPAERISIHVRGTLDSEAYDHYLHGRFLWNQRDAGAVAESADAFRRAAEIDPTFALAHAGLADAYVVLGMYGTRAPADAYPLARDSADRALTIDPASGEAMTSRACVSAAYEWRWADAEQRFRRAIELAPSHATAHQWYATTVLTSTQRFPEALAALDRALALDPVSSAIATSKGIVHFYAGEYSRARAELEAIIREQPHFGLAHHFLGLCHQAEGHAQEALASAEAAVRHSGASAETVAARGAALAAYGRVAEAEGVLADLGARAQRSYVSPVLLAQVLVALGRHADALAELERALELRATDLIWLGVRPSYDALSGSERFAAVLSQVGLVRS